MLSGDLLIDGLFLVIGLLNYDSHTQRQIDLFACYLIMSFCFFEAVVHQID